MDDGENILQSVKTAIQDVVAPDVRELKVKMDALDKRISSVETNLDKRISSVETNLDKRISSVESNLKEQIGSLERHMREGFTASNARADAQFHALLAAINQNKAETELMVYKQVSALADRVTVIEAQLKQQDARRAA